MSLPCRPSILAALAAATVLVACPAAGAATITASAGTLQGDPGAPPEFQTPYFFTTVTVKGEAAEADDLTVSLPAPGATVTMTSAAAPVTAGPGCTQVTAVVATCFVSGAPVTQIDLGAGDDHLALAPWAPVGRPKVDAGPGDDRVEVAYGDVDGGDGDDHISELSDAGIPNPTLVANGGPGADVITGGKGGDKIEGGAGSDTLDGGPGEEDTVSWAHEAEPVTANLADAAVPGGPASAPDSISGFEHAIGGSGNDALRGSALRNELSGGDGADTLDGRGGDDVLAGNAGADQIAGGEGEDFLTGGTGNDVLDGGAARDQLNGEDGADTLHGGGGDDTLTDSETQPARDLLFGDDGRDRLVGYGADELRGGTGADTLSADYAAESGDPRSGAVLDGGAGNDAIDVASGSRTVVCGTGRDALSLLGVVLTVPADCETLRPQTADGAVHALLPVRPTVRGARASVRVPGTICAAASRRHPCRVRLDLRDARSGHLLGAARRSLTSRAGIRSLIVTLRRARCGAFRVRARVRVHAVTASSDTAWRTTVVPRHCG